MFDPETQKPAKLSRVVGRSNRLETYASLIPPMGTHPPRVDTRRNNNSR
jgi:hypothetical protein